MVLINGVEYAHHLEAYDMCSCAHTCRMVALWKDTAIFTYILTHRQHTKQQPRYAKPLSRCTDVARCWQIYLFPKHHTHRSYIAVDVVRSIYELEAAVQQGLLLWLQVSDRLMEQKE